MNEKILIIQTAFPGDAILTLPLIQILNEQYSNSIIDVICIPSTAEIFSASPYVNDVIILDKKNKHRNLFSLFMFSLRLSKRKYSMLFSPHRSFRTSLIVLLSGIRNTTGFDISSMSFVYKNKIKYEKDFHEVQRNLKLIENKVKIKNWKIIPDISMDIESVKRVDEYLEKFANKKIAAVAPGSVWNTKIYPEEYYSEIISYFLKNDFEVILIGGKSDKEICNRISSNFKYGVFSTAGLFTIIESIELLKSCEILICNDSAPSHMAMCADIPVLTLYCSTVPSFGFYPYGKNSSFLSFDDLNCKPCGIHGHKKCPVSTFDCGLKLKPLKVIEKVEEMILQK